MKVMSIIGMSIKFIGSIIIVYQLYKEYRNEKQKPL